MADRHKKKADPSEGPTSMSGEAFRAWRKRLGLKQKDAADLLGLKKRMIQYYETGKRSGSDVAIPKSIRLACFALENGVGDYDGETVSRLAPVPAARLQIIGQSAPETIDEALDETAGETMHEALERTAG